MSKKDDFKKIKFKLTERTNLNSTLIFLKKILQELENEQTVILKSEEKDIEIRPKGDIDFRLKVKESRKRDISRQKFILELSWETSALPVAEEWVLIGAP